MTDEKPPTKDNAARDMAIRSTAIEMAIRSNCGQCYDTNNKLVFDGEEIVKAAKLFENFIKGIDTLIKPALEPNKDEWK